MRWLLAMFLLVPAAASAQRVELGTITVDVPPPPRLSDFVIISRLEVPRVAQTEVPAATIPAFDAYYDARDAVRRTTATLRAVSPPGPDGAHTSAYDVELARVEGAAARERTARDALVRALSPFDTTLSRPALLVLGMLRFRAAEEAYARALEVADACVAAGRQDCVAPTNEDALAVATWARVAGGDVLAAWSLYERGHSLYEHQTLDDARHALEGALAVPHLPARLEATAALLLGELLATDAPDVAASAYARCGALASEPLAPHCALRAGAMLPDSDALAVLAPWLDTPAVQSDAHLFVGEIFARAEALPSLDALAPPLRARALTIGAERLALYGMTTRALAAIEAARTLAASPALDALATRIALARTMDTPEAWLRRSVLFCARAEDTVGFGRIEIRGRFTPHGARAIVTGRVHPTELAPLAACLARATLAPETPLRGSFHAEVVLGARTDAFVPHIRTGEP